MCLCCLALSVGLCVLFTGSSVMVAFEPNTVLEHKVFIGGFKCLYHLTKQEQAHQTSQNYWTLTGPYWVVTISQKLKVNEGSTILWICLYFLHLIFKNVTRLLFHIVLVCLKIDKRPHTRYRSEITVEEMLKRFWFKLWRSLSSSMPSGHL